MATAEIGQHVSTAGSLMFAPPAVKEFCNILLASFSHGMKNRADRVFRKGAT